MIAAPSLRGVCAAVITPVDSSLRPDPNLAIPYYRDLLARGCDGLNVLGTTGEAFSLSVDDRLRFMESVAGSDLPRDRMMVGTGASALGDAIRLTAAAFRLGFGAALIMPPFFFRDVTDDGVVRFFDLLFAAVHPPEGRTFLYNFPQMSGVRFHPQLVDRLMQAFPGVIAGMKDSSNDTALQEAVAKLRPELAIFPSSEAYLTASRTNGFAGCISGSVALWPELAASVWRGDAESQPRLSAQRAALAGFSLINAVRYLAARRAKDPAWERCLPPLSPLSKEAALLLADALERGRAD
jgi:4-hydroxy-tetrahydrodipicolinate synthase